MILRVEVVNVLFGWKICQRRRVTLYGEHQCSEDGRQCQEEHCPEQARAAHWKPLDDIATEQEATRAARYTNHTCILTKQQHTVCLGVLQYIRARSVE